jgi:serine O-acetyltransferase
MNKIQALELNNCSLDMETYEKDPVWAMMCHEAKQMTIRTPILASAVYAIILNHKTLEASLAFCLSNKIASSTVTAT